MGCFAPVSSALGARCLCPCADKGEEEAWSVDSLITYITSGPVVVLVVTGKNMDIGRNLIHASDSPENGEMEVSLFFRPEELVEMHRSTDQWIYE
jgi:hypothetical protein